MKGYAVVLESSRPIQSTHQVAWESLQPDRFSNISTFHHGFGPHPVFWDRANLELRKQLGVTVNGPHSHQHEPSREARLHLALDRSLGTLRSPSTTLPGARRVFIDLGARNPVGSGSSIDFFRREYPEGETFEVYAFEADTRFAPMYEGMPNVTLVQGAVASFDGDCYFSGESAVGSSMSPHQRGGDVSVKCVSLMRWLKHHVKPEDLVVMKMDIEKGEFKLAQQLLKHPSTARLIDEMMLECHHEETWGNGPHKYVECVEMFEALQGAGLWMHEWF